MWEREREERESGKEINQYMSANELMPDLKGYSFPIFSCKSCPLKQKEKI